MWRSKVTWMLLAIGVVGCGGSEFDLAPVSGVVTLNGEPLANARVSFQPRRSGDAVNSGPASYATTDERGHFQLHAIDGSIGAVVGTHDVTVSTFLANPDRSVEQVRIVAKERVPRQYQRPGSLVFSVPQEGNQETRVELIGK